METEALKHAHVHTHALALVPFGSRGPFGSLQAALALDRRSTLMSAGNLLRALSWTHQQPAVTGETRIALKAEDPE